MRVVTGTFHDRERASEAIQELVAAGIPVDEISVEVAEPEGEHPVQVIRTSPTIRGGFLGGAIGVALGAVGAILVANGMMTGLDALFLTSGPVLTVLQGAVAGAGLGFAVGVLASITPVLWKEDAVLQEEDLVRGTALVSVHSDELHDRAREVLARVRAERVGQGPRRLR